MIKSKAIRIITEFEQINFLNRNLSNFKNYGSTSNQPSKSQVSSYTFVPIKSKTNKKSTPPTEGKKMAHRRAEIADQGENFATSRCLLPFCFALFLVLCFESNCYFTRFKETSRKIGSFAVSGVVLGMFAKHFFFA